jgi:hypothetical protein
MLLFCTCYYVHIVFILLSWGVIFCLWFQCFFSRKQDWVPQKMHQPELNPSFTLKGGKKISTTFYTTYIFTYFINSYQYIIFILLFILHIFSHICYVFTILSILHIFSHVWCVYNIIFNMYDTPYPKYVIFYLLTTQYSMEYMYVALWISYMLLFVFHVCCSLYFMYVALCISCMLLFVFHVCCLIYCMYWFIY